MGLLISCGSDLSYEAQIEQYYNLISSANSLNNNKNFEQALIKATEAIKITDTLSSGFVKRGVANLGLKKYKDAEDDFSETIELQGEWSIGYRGRAIAFFYQNEKSDFIEDMDIYISYHSNDAFAHALRGDYYFEDKEYEKAILDYSICLNINPQNSAMYIKRGIAYAQDEQNELSVKDYESYTNLNPNKNNDAIYYEKGLLNVKSNNFKKALDDFSLISKSFKTSNVLELKGDCYYNLRDYKKALSSYNEHLKITVESYTVLEKRGNTYLSLNNTKKANSDFKEMAYIKWKFKSFFFKYGWYIIFILIYFITSLLIFGIIQNKNEYDNKKISKSYKYLFLTGLFGGHLLYTNYYSRYLLHTILIFLLLFFNIYNIRSFYNHLDLLFSGFFNTQYSAALVYLVIGLFVIDLIFLSYYIFSENHKIRLSIDNNVSKQRESEIKKIGDIIDTQRTNFNTLKL